MTAGSLVRRFTAGAAACALLLLLGAAPALAGVGEPVTGAVDDTTEAAGAAAGGTIDAVTGAASDAADTADEATGGVTEAVTDPIQDAIDKANGAVNDATSAVDDTVDKASATVDDAVDKANDATGGVIDDVTGEDAQHNEGPGKGFDAPGPFGAHARAVRANARIRSAHHARRRANAHNDGLSAASRSATSTIEPNLRPTALATSASPSLGERLRRAAVEAAKQFAIPLALTLVVFGFVVAQYWADRKDPKLRLAPVNSDHDLLSFQ